MGHDHWIRAADSAQWRHLNRMFERLDRVGIPDVNPCCVDRAAAYRQLGLDAANGFSTTSDDRPTPAQMRPRAGLTEGPT